MRLPQPLKQYDQSEEAQFRRRVEQELARGGTNTSSTTIISGGSASDTSKVWPYDELPVTPSALDDDFNGTSLDSKWIPFGGAGLTTTVKRGWLMLETTATGVAANLRGVEQILPSGNFSVVTPVRQLGAGMYSISGLHVRNSTTGAILRINHFNNANSLNNWWTGTAKYSGFTNRTGVQNEAPTSVNEVMFRISYDGTNIVASLSIDGLNFYPITSEAIGTTFGGGLPDRVGLAVDPFSTTLVGRAGFRGFRYVNAANMGMGAFAP